MLTQIQRRVLDGDYFMRLTKLKITNFRCYKDETVIDLDDLVVFVGKNDSGKSSIFDALNIFFEGKAAPDKDDACVYTDDATVRIACVFDDVPLELVIDAQQPTDLASEHLLNGDGHLEIVKVYNCKLAKPKCSGVYAHAAHPTADGYADLLSLTNAKLKQRAKSLGVDLTDVNQSVNTELRRAIWEHADDLQYQEIEVELKAEAAKAIWDQLKKHLPVYAVFKSDRPSTDQDAKAQDQMKAAVKEAIKAQAGRPGEKEGGTVKEGAMNPREQSMNPNEPSKENTAGILRLFVYGTLKRGCWNHERFCRGVLSVEDAVVRDHLYEMPSGIPVLQVPEADILAHGTADPLADAAAQARSAEDLASILEPVPESATAGDWAPVYLSAVPSTAQAGGEFLTFDDPETRLPAINRLQGVHPVGPSLYRRVLVPVCIRQEVVVGAWAYAGESEQRFRRLLLAGRRPS